MVVHKVLFAEVIGFNDIFKISILSIIDTLQVWN